MPVRARRMIRKMRGGAQAHLLECDDGHSYVVKFRNNPQHRRILVNEWLATVFLKYLQIHTPDAAIVETDAGFLAAHPEAGIQLGGRSAPAETGWHYGSRFPGDPSRMAVFDFLPDVLLPKVVNLREFHGVFVFDKWTGNADARQSIYYRPASTQEEPRSGFLAVMVDHGYVFDGPNWSFVDSPLQGFYHRASVYEGVRGWSDFEPWLERVRHFPVEVIDSALKQIPRQWIAGEEDQLEQVLETLLIRCRSVDQLIEAARAGRRERFPNWK